MNRRLMKRLYIEDLIKRGSLKITVNDKPRYLTYTHPGLQYTDFDVYDQPDLTKMMIYVILAEDLAENAHTLDDGGRMCSFLYWDDLLKDRTFFLGSVQYTFTRILYNPSTQKWPLDVKFSFGGIGSTSLLLKSEFYLVNSQELVMSRLTKLVAVGRQSRKPVPHPGWYREKMAGKEVPMDNLIFNGFQKPPRGTFLRRIQIVLSDTDRNRHTNFASYVRFGLDTLHLALTLQARRKVTETKENSQSKLNPQMGHTKTDVSGHTKTDVSGHTKTDVSGHTKTDVSGHTKTDVSGHTKTDVSGHTKTDLSLSEQRMLNVDCQTCESDDSCRTHQSSTMKDGAGSKIAENLILIIDTALPWMTLGIMRNGTKNLKICYLKECVEGDFVDVHIWQEKGEELAVRCSVDSVDGSPLAQFILEYFGNLSNL